LRIKQLPGKVFCTWHKDNQVFGKIYKDGQIFPGKVCPFLYHSLYPYFLGLLYHANMNNIHVCCPAEEGVDLYVKRADSNTIFRAIPESYWIIYAEIVAVNGECDYNHEVGQNILFPDCFKKEYMCPAAINNIFPFLDIEIPKCINLNKLRCPDWKEDLYFSLEDE